jgi:hypothetical protein
MRLGYIKIIRRYKNSDRDASMIFSKTKGISQTNQKFISEEDVKISQDLCF